MTATQERIQPFLYPVFATGATLLMRLPYRKPGKYSQHNGDYFLTPEKKTQLEKKLKTLKTLQRPQAASEVARLAELGDFSENVEYQLAKGRLRRINNNILRLEHLLNQAVIIAPPKGNAIQIGHKVTITENGKTKIYHILGSEETNPEKGIISHRSPIGVALLGHKIGDIVEVGLPGKTILYTIVQIV